MKKKNTRPIRKKEQVQESNDERIDQDYPGFLHPPSKKETISNGSANAFEGTEEVTDDEDSDEDDDDHFLRGRDGSPDRGK